MTKLYLREDYFWHANRPVTLGSKSVNYNWNAFGVNGDNYETLLLSPAGRGGAALYSYFASNGSTTAQKAYLARCISPLLAAQTINAQTWTISIGAVEGNAAANMFLNPVVYVYRPSTSSVVGYIRDSATAIGTEFGTSVASIVATFSGSAVTCQAGDVLVLEVCVGGTQSMATVYGQQVTFNGFTEYATNATTLPTTATYAAYLDVPQTLSWQSLATQKALRVATGSGGQRGYLLTQSGYSRASGFRFSGQYRRVLNKTVGVSTVASPTWCCPDASNYYRLFVMNDGNWNLELNLADVKTTLTGGVGLSMTDPQAWQSFDISHTASGKITIVWNGQTLLSNFVDTTLTTGSFGLICDDGTYELANVSSTEFADGISTLSESYSEGALGAQILYGSLWFASASAAFGASLATTMGPSSPLTPTLLSRPTDGGGGGPSAATLGGMFLVY